MGFCMHYLHINTYNPTKLQPNPANQKASNGSGWKITATLQQNPANKKPFLAPDRKVSLF